MRRCMNIQSVAKGRRITASNNYIPKLHTAIIFHHFFLLSTLDVYSSSSKIIVLHLFLSIFRSESQQQIKNDRKTLQLCYMILFSILRYSCAWRIGSGETRDDDSSKWRTKLACLSREYAKRVCAASGTIEADEPAVNRESLAPLEFLRTCCLVRTPFSLLPLYCRVLVGFLKRAIHEKQKQPYVEKKS